MASVLGTSVPFQYDAATRRSGPQFNYFGAGPGVVATSHGSQHPWTSIIFENDIGGQPQEVEVELHSLDPTPIVPGQEAQATQYFVKLFLVPPSVLAPGGIPVCEIYNVGLLSTETWVMPAHIIVNPGYGILAITSSQNAYGLTWRLNIHTVV